MNKNDINNNIGMIPDFFHDILAYLVPGYTVLIVLLTDLYLLRRFSIDFSCIEKINIYAFVYSLIIAYIIGRFFEQMGKMIIHNIEYKSPKLALINGEDNIYSKEFRNILKVKINEWLKSTMNDKFVEKCLEENKDDYFNLIQYYLRERYPAVALYEKKQNATIVLTRSLCIVFGFNSIIILFFLILYLCNFLNAPNKQVILWKILLPLILNCLFCFVFYKRFRLDQKYHAMYIFETFLGLKKLLKKRKREIEVNINN